ncbi:MAG: hypothetical protein NTU49_10270, partial [Gammaproteobacteria bacterium]|nr:hypothetical protein [Gammaproteobacteria bacterium]
MKKVHVIFSRLVFLGVFIATLGGCSHPSPCQKYLNMKLVREPRPLVQEPKPISPILLRMYYVCELQKNGVQVIRLGQTWKLVFPSDALFDNQTPEINDSYKPLLNIAAYFMRTYS